MNINEALQTGREALLKNGIDPRETRLLLAFAMGIKYEELIKYKECSEEQYKFYIELVHRRSAGEPYAYIVGYKEFMKLNFKVNSNVLIPREDTEILVQEIIKLAPNYIINLKANNFSLVSDDLELKEVKPQKEYYINILDMCTGSGCIAISLAKYIKDAKVTAIDISEKALEIARENAIINDVKVDLIKSNLFEKLTTNVNEELCENQKFDIIVSNPPYIKRNVIQELQKEVKNEPIIALDGGDSGVEFYEKITKEAKKYLKENGILAFEIGFDQGESVTKILKDNKYKNIEVKKDFGGNNRVVIGRK